MPIIFGLLLFQGSIEIISLLDSHLISGLSMEFKVVGPRQERFCRQGSEMEPSDTFGVVSGGLYSIYDFYNTMYRERATTLILTTKTDTQYILPGLDWLVYCWGTADRF